MVEQLTVNQLVPGSSPGRGAKKFRAYSKSYFLYPSRTLELFVIKLLYDEKHKHKKF